MEKESKYMTDNIVLLLLPEKDKTLKYYNRQVTCLETIVVSGLQKALQFPFLFVKHYVWQQTHDARERMTKGSWQMIVDVCMLFQLCEDDVGCTTSTKRTHETIQKEWCGCPGNSFVLRNTLQI